MSYEVVRVWRGMSFLTRNLVVDEKKLSSDLTLENRRYSDKSRQGISDVDTLPSLSQEDSTGF